ncbi:hypothetical protein Tco_1125035 [Tanacetum coccineum]|uniref:Uncharacterized protein n=1 Tax=Tanacetum coccineum TaxID=301880 RepID=A0ABQ5J9A3_9ASTR
MSYRHQELTSPEQTATGKDFPNPLIVDSLLKTIWSSMHHVITMKHWLVQSKRLLPSSIHIRSYPTQYLTSLLMAQLDFCDKHNMVAFLKKSTGSAGFHQIIDFITRSHICYALTKKPEVCVSFIKQFWRSAEILTDDNGTVKIRATIDGHSLSITEGSLRRHLKLELQRSLLNWRLWAMLLTQINTEIGEDDSSKQGRKFSKEGVQDDEGVHEKASNDTGYFLSATLVTTGGPVYNTSRRSAEKRSRKDKGKAILIEEEPKKKSKKDIEQEKLSFAEAIRLEEQMHEEQRAQIARDAEIARQWDEEERKRAMDEAEATKKIDWNDPSVLRYHSLKMKPKSIAQARRNMIKYLKNQGNFKITDFKGMSYNEVRPIFEKLWDFNQKFVPMDAEKASKKQKSPEKERSSEKIVEEEAVAQEEKEEVVKEPAAKRKKSIPRKTTRKRQKLEEDTDKDELKTFLDIVPREDAPIEVDSLSTKFPIVDWKTVVLTETFMYYQVFRGDGSSKNYKILSEMLQDFDRMDVEQLFRLVKERYSFFTARRSDLMLWGDLHTLFEPDEDDEIWKDQHEYNLLSWRLCDFYDSVMSDLDESGVTYIEISSTFEELSDIGSPGVVPSPVYIPGPEEPQSPPPLDYVPEPIYPEYMPQEDESDPEADPKEDDDEDPEEDPVDYPADGGDDDDDEEGSSEDDEDDDMDIEADDDDDEEEEHPALANSVVVSLLATG